MSTRQGRPSGIVVPEGSVKARGMVHKLVADTAKGIGGACWEEACMRSNDFYKLWPNPEEFVTRRWSSFVQDARKTLATMLAMPDGQVSPAQKEEIHQALLLNAAVNPAANLVDDMIAGKTH